MVLAAAVDRSIPAFIARLFRGGLGRVEHPKQEQEPASGPVVGLVVGDGTLRVLGRLQGIGVEQGVEGHHPGQQWLVDGLGAGLIRDHDGPHRSRALAEPDPIRPADDATHIGSIPPSLGIRARMDDLNSLLQEISWNQAASLRSPNMRFLRELDMRRPGRRGAAGSGGRASVQPSTWGGRSGRMDRAILTGQDLEFGIQCLPGDMVTSAFDNRRSGRSHRGQEEIVCMHFIFQGPQNPLYPLGSSFSPY